MASGSVPHHPARPKHCENRCLRGHFRRVESDDVKFAGRPFPRLCSCSPFTSGARRASPGAGPRRRSRLSSLALELPLMSIFEPSRQSDRQFPHAARLSSPGGRCVEAAKSSAPSRVPGRTHAAFDRHGLEQQRQRRRLAAQRDRRLPAQATRSNSICPLGHVTSPITLTTGSSTIAQNLKIVGPGASQLTISGNELQHGLRRRERRERHDFRVDDC